MQVNIILILSLLYICSGQNPKPPEPIKWPAWAEHLIAAHLINMTAELIKDADYKLAHASKIQEKYMHTITYELGAIAAGIQDTYKHMLEIYRTLTNMTHFMGKTYDVYFHLNSYHIVQGDYNQIRIEQNMFNDILQKHEEQRREYEKRQRRLRSTTPKDQRRRGAGVKWRDGEKKVWGSRMREIDFMKMN